MTETQRVQRRVGGQGGPRHGQDRTVSIGDQAGAAAALRCSAVEARRPAALSASARTRAAQAAAPSAPAAAHVAAMGHAQRVSRHGTLTEKDTTGAVAVNVQRVIEHCQTATTNTLFGSTGKLPPSAARIVEQRYVVWHSLRDEKAGLDWIGLNKVTNAEKGNIGPIQLVPGEYKLELKLSKQLNRNFAHELTGSLVGGLSSIGAQDVERAKEIQGRGLPNAYVDVRALVQAKFYAIADVRGVLDLGVHSTFTRVFAVQPTDTVANLHLQMYSHSVLKRLKVEGVLYRRDFTPEEPDHVALRSRVAAARKGKEILNKALSGNRDATLRTRLDEDVVLFDVVKDFYAQVAPDRLGKLDGVFQHFAGRDDDLIATLEVKYNAQFDRRGKFVVKEAPEVP